jgi:hypothetical protein
MPSEKNEEADDANAFFTKLSILSNNNNGERIEEQVKQICKAVDQIDKYIEMLRGTGLNYTADSMARNTAEIKLRQKLQTDAAIATGTGGAAVITMSRRIQSQGQQEQHQFVKRYARFRMRCPRQVIEIVSAPIYAEDVITAYPSYNYDYCEWCHYKKVETLGES